METTTNVFVNMILNKVAFSWRHLFKYLSHKKELKKFRKKIDEGSPSFGLLWKMADFIKYAEEIFFYDNSLKGNNDIMLYSSRSFAPGENGFKIVDPRCTITIKLLSESQKCILEVSRNSGAKLKNTMEFISDNWSGEPTAYDEMLLEQVIKMINSCILKLFDFCYNER